MAKQTLNTAQQQRPIMSINLSASPTAMNFPTIWVAAKVPLNSIFFENDPKNQLSYNSNGIQVGANVSKVLVTGTFAWYNNGGQADMIGSIQKNGSIISSAFYENSPATSNYITTPITPVVISVVANDIIYMYCAMGATGNRNLFAFTSLCVEILE